MEHELLTRPLSDAELRTEVAFALAHLRESGFEECNVLFGYAWGAEYYPGDKWVSETIPLALVLTKVAEVEGRGIGRVGADDLYLEFPTFSFLFCHDSDVHLRFAAVDDLVEFFFSRWEQLGYKPAEWRSNEAGSKVKVRGGDANA